MTAEAQTLYRTPLAGVIKAAPAQLVLGAVNDPLPAAYANVGLYVTVQQTGWQSLDSKTFRVSAVIPGTSSNAPGITLEGSDVTHETAGSIPRNDAFVEIRQTPNNFARYVPPSGAGSSLDPSAAAFVAAVQAAGGSVSTGRQTLYSNLAASLRTAGVLAKLSRLGIMAAENVQSCKVDLIDPTKQLIFVGAPTFTADQGVVSVNGLNYVDTGFAAPSALFTQDSAFDLVGTLSTRAVGADNALLGNAQVAGGSAIYGLSSGNTTIGSVNNGNAFATNWASSGSIKGLYVNTRRSVAGSENYKNGVSVNTSAQTSAAPAPQNFLIGCWRNNDGTSIYAFDGGIVSCWAVGSQLSAADVTALTIAINTYMTAIGHALY